MPGLWVSPTEFVDFSEAVDKADLMEDIAVRSRAWDWGGFFGIMPDPDPVLRKLPDGGVSVLESLTADGHLCSVIQSRKLGTLKKEFRWDAGSLAGEKPSAQATKLAESLIADLERVDLYNLLSGILDAPLYGMTPVEISWKGEGGRAKIKDLQCKPCRWFGFDDANNPKFISKENPFGGEALPFGKFVFARHFPTYDNPYGLRLISRCLWPGAFKKGGWKFWSILAEKYGVPFLIGKHRPGATGTEKREMLSNLAAMVQDAVAVIPQGGTVEILETGKSGGGGDVHHTMISASNAEMSKVIMLQTLTAEVSYQGGSRAQATVQQDVLEDCRVADQMLVKTVMEEIAWVYGQVNAPGVPTPCFSWFEEDDPKKDMADRDKTLTDTGVRFTKSYYIRQYNFQDDDFELVESLPDGRGSDLSRADKASEFAEPGQHKFTPEQQAIEDVADQALVDGAEMFAGNESKIWAVIEASGSYEEALTRLLELYPELDMSNVEDLLERLWFNAELHGYRAASLIK